MGKTKYMGAAQYNDESDSHVMKSECHVLKSALRLGAWHEPDSHVTTKEDDMVCKMIGKMRGTRIWGWFCYIGRGTKNLTHI